MCLGECLGSVWEVFGKCLGECWGEFADCLRVFEECLDASGTPCVAAVQFY